MNSVYVESLMREAVEDKTTRTVTLGPVVSRSGLAEDEVVWPEEVAEGSSPDGVHSSRLEIDEDGSGDVLAAWRGRKIEKERKEGFGKGFEHAR
jgi:hypothetical protein